ncbi:heavy metal translocating P-type ATPase [Herbiconiux sp. A18JL235]|uniref:Heavy metal translocating P-type ATPase n=1 Tax=Herbiconiux sp. A18JL235 TaxID=3152363 RepID=A0AB39BC77_9MICO
MGGVVSSPVKRLRYPLVAATVVVGATAGVLVLAGVLPIARGLVALYALGIAGVELARMIRRLRRGVIGVDVLAVIAIVSTVLVGEFLAALIIVLMLTGGEALEDFAQSRAERELTALLNRAPRIAHRMSSAAATQTIVDISIDDVVEGDVLLVRPSEIVPVDGALVEGTGPSDFDESSLTGESLPVERRGGDQVLSGSVNGSAAVRMVASRDAAHSQYQSIVTLVTEAAAHPAPVVRLADRFALPFTGVALLIGVTAWVLSGDAVRFAEVLVLATPCPLIIAAPIAFMAGMSRSAKAGVVVKGGAVLERLARIRTVVFDKTGTLTEGRPTVTRVRWEPGFSEDRILRLAASAEEYSSHVLAASIIALARARGLGLLPAERAEEVATAGVMAVIDGDEVRVGKLAFIHERAPMAAAPTLEAGELAIYVSVNDRFAGVIIARDPLRSNARAAISELQRRGARRVVMLTGDAHATASSIAELAGISDVRASCLPADKVSAVAGMDDRPVMMVGDGVNDAPVLAAADVGIAMGARGATAASDSADVVILVDDLSKTVDAVAIGQDSVRIALQSLWLGIALSVLLMIVASFGLIPAAVGAGIQEAVDLVCIVNALRALRGRGDRSRDGSRPR